MDSKVREALRAAGWVELVETPGAFVRGEELVRREPVQWIQPPSDIVRQIEDAAKRDK